MPLLITTFSPDGAAMHMTRYLQISKGKMGRERVCVCVWAARDKEREREEGGRKKINKNRERMET